MHLSHIYYIFTILIYTSDCWSMSQPTNSFLHSLPKCPELLRADRFCCSSIEPASVNFLFSLCPLLKKENSPCAFRMHNVCIVVTVFAFCLYVLRVNRWYLRSFNAIDIDVFIRVIHAFFWEREFLRVTIELTMFTILIIDIENSLKYFHRHP